MKIRYIGDPANAFEGPAEITQYGVTFVKGEFIDLPDDHQYAQKFKGNQTFEVKGVDRPKVEVDSEADLNELRDALDKKGVKFHHREKADSLRAKLSKVTETGPAEDVAENPPVPK